jgi:hypothetical protein
VKPRRTIPIVVVVSVCVSTGHQGRKVTRHSTLSFLVCEVVAPSASWCSHTRWRRHAHSMYTTRPHLKLNSNWSTNGVATTPNAVVVVSARGSIKVAKQCPAIPWIYGHCPLVPHDGHWLLNMTYTPPCTTPEFERSKTDDFSARAPTKHSLGVVKADISLPACMVMMGQPPSHAGSLHT